MMKPEWAGSLGASRVAALTLGSLILALALATVPLDVLSRQGSPAEPLIGAASFAAVGLVVARRQPRNPWGGCWRSSDCWCSLASSGATTRC